MSLYALPRKTFLLTQLTFLLSFYIQVKMSTKVVIERRVNYIQAKVKLQLITFGSFRLPCASHQDPAKSGLKLGVILNRKGVILSPKDQKGFILDQLQTAFKNGRGRGS